jgi:hypothetical protein
MQVVSRGIAELGLFKSCEFEASLGFGVVVADVDAEGVHRPSFITPGILLLEGSCYISRRHGQIHDRSSNSMIPKAYWAVALPRWQPPAQHRGRSQSS